MNLWDDLYRNGFRVGWDAPRTRSAPTAGTINAITWKRCLDDQYHTSCCGGGVGCASSESTGTKTTSADVKDFVLCLLPTTKQWDAPRTRSAPTAGTINAITWKRCLDDQYQARTVRHSNAGVAGLLRVLNQAQREALTRSTFRKSIANKPL